MVLFQSIGRPEYGLIALREKIHNTIKSKIQVSKYFNAIAYRKIMTAKQPERVRWYQEG